MKSVCKEKLLAFLVTASSWIPGHTRMHTTIPSHSHCRPNMLFLGSSKHQNVTKKEIDWSNCLEASKIRQARRTRCRARYSSSDSSDSRRFVYRVYVCCVSFSKAAYLPARLFAASPSPDSPLIRLAAVSAQLPAVYWQLVLNENKCSRTTLSI